MSGSIPERQLLGYKRQYCVNFLPYLAFIVLFRLIITFMEPYAVDMAGYKAWSNYLAEYGPSQLYGNSGFHIVYAPFFQYFLWFTGEIAVIFSLTETLHGYLIKLWPVIFEFIGAWLILFLSEKTNRLRTGAYTAMIFLLNPGVFINSSIWGQFDSIPATMLLGVITLFECKRHNAAAILFLAAVLTKPQSGLLLPVVLYLYFRDFRFDTSSFIRLITGLLSGIFVYLAIILPFYIPTRNAPNIPGFLDPFYWLFDLYFRSVGDYPFATANAFNFWTLMGGQIRPDTLPFLGLSYLAWCNILVLLAFIYAAFCLIKGKGSLYAVVYFSFLIQFSAFFFMTKMHERYLLPAIIFIMLSTVFDRRHIPAACMISFCVFINHLYLYIISFDKIYWLDRWDALALVISFLTLITYILSLYQGYRAFIRPAASAKET